MDQKAILNRVAILQKAQKEPLSGPQVLGILKDLRENVVATEELLRATKVGVSVSRLKQHSDPQVQRESSELVSRWRAAVKGNSGRRPPTGAPPGSGSSTPNVNAAPNGTSSPAAMNQSPAPAVKRTHNVAPEKRNAQTDGVKTEVTGNQSRDACVKLMYNGLSFMSTEMPDDILRKAREVETAAFSTYADSPAYKEKIRSLFQNLKNKSNAKLRVRVFSGEIAAARFVTMTHEDLKSDELKAEEERMQKENMSNAMVAQEEKSISTTFTCGKCRQKKVSYSQAQTRSADEPMTTFCECTNCGNRWKFS